MRIALSTEAHMDRIHFDKAMNALPESERRLATCREKYENSPAGSPTH